MLVIQFIDNNILTYSGVKKLPYCSLCIASTLHREHSPANFHSDFIEQKTTCGGLALIKSMYENSFNIYAKNSACRTAYPATCDLNLVNINQPKTKFRVGTEFIPVRVRMGV